MAEPYTWRELLVVLIARELRDGEVGVAPTTDPAIAACLLAQQRHAPNLTFLTISGFVNSKPSELYPGAADFRYVRGAEAFTNFYDVFEYCETGLDYMIYTGMQIDRFGNLNYHWFGPEGKRTRGPGLANISHPVTAKRGILYKQSHTKRDFVGRVDFLTAPGHVDEQGGRAAAGIRTPGPVRCMTPLATLDFDPHGVMRIRSVHPGATAAQVRASTGFELAGSEPAPETEPPSADELLVLRRAVDPTGYLRRR